MLLFFFFSCTRCAISVTQSSRTMTPNITAVPAGRASAMAALPKLRLSLREAGVLPLSESVTSATSREPHTQVHTLSIMSNALLCVLCSHLRFGWALALADIFIHIYAEMLEAELEEEEGGTLARKVGEAVTNTIGVVVTAIDIPLGECCPKQNLKNILM